MAESLDPYQVLGLKPGATDDEIHQAYRKLATQFHPDVNSAPNASAQFQALTAAYEFLANPANQTAAPAVNRADADGHFQDLRDAVAAFISQPIAIDTCKAFVLALESPEPARTASLDAIVHLFLNHDNAGALVSAVLPLGASDAAEHSVVEALLASSSLALVRKDLLPGVGGDATEATLSNAADKYLKASFVAVSDI